MFKIFVTFLMVSTALPVHARPQVVVGKPKIVYFKISLFPPPKYDVPYEGNLEIRLYSSLEAVRAACPTAESVIACARSSIDHKRCELHVLTEDAAKRIDGTMPSCCATSLHTAMDGIIR